MNYVIIGDVHGMFDALETLLQTLGFSKKNNAYQHPKYIAIFAGDFVDRGKRQRDVIELIRAMVEHGSAKAILGNHEYGVIYSYSINPETQQPQLVCNSRLKEECNTILKDYPLAGKDTTDMIEWLKSLPLYLQLDQLRVVHATWDEIAIEKLEPFTEQGQLTSEGWRQAVIKTGDLYRLIRPLIRGVTARLPDHLKTHPHAPYRRDYRVSWWKNDWSSWEKILCSASDAKIFAEVELPSEPIIKPHSPEQTALFFGHYWFKGTPKPITRNLACLDYSACIGGHLVAYVWNHADNPNKNGLREDRFIRVPSLDYRE
jgi:hypothetical protein